MVRLWGFISSLNVPIADGSIEGAVMAILKWKR
jgi:hypothetical protein